MSENAFEMPENDFHEDLHTSKEITTDNEIQRPVDDQILNEEIFVNEIEENSSASCKEELIECTQDCSGRIIFEYTHQCMPSFNVRYFMAELQEHCLYPQTRAG